MSTTETATASGARRILPADDDRDTAGFWEAARRHELVVRACDSCAAVLHMPRAYCKHCGSWEGSWKPVSGRGTVYSWTVAEHQVHPAYPAPYTVVLVELEDEPSVRLMGYLPGTPHVAAGQRVQVWFEHLQDSVVLPQWELVDEDEGEHS
jgi:uncharacterized OB-fold protein